MNLLFIRHGEKAAYEGDVTAVELTAKGWRQADLVGQRLLTENVRIIYSSSMTRALQTAEAINKHLNVEIEVRSELREIDMGECDTKGWDYVNSQHPYFISEFQKHERDIPYPNGECGADVWFRSKKVLDEIIHLDLDNVAIVTHGGTIRSMICGALGIAQEKRFFLGQPLEHCSISLIKLENSMFFLHSLNDYTHLVSEV